MAAVDRQALRGLLEQLGATSNEARVLLALLELGPSRPSQLALHCELGRTNVYPLLEALQRKRLADQLPGTAGLWSAPPAEEVVDHLYAIQAERLRSVADTAERAREALAQLAPKEPAATLPCVYRVDAPSQVPVVVNQLVAQAESEILLFDHPPYAWTAGTPNPIALEAMARGVRVRELCLASQLSDRGFEARRRERAGYIAAGQETRVVDELPVKLLVVDRRASVLVPIPHGSPEGAYPTVLVIEHPGCAQVHADSFEARWATARPYAVLSDVSADGSASKKKAPTA